MPCAPPGDLPDPGIELASFTSPALAGRVFTTGTTQEAPSLLEIAQKKVGDVIQPSHPLSPSSPALNLLLPELYVDLCHQNESTSKSKNTSRNRRTLFFNILFSNREIP